MLFDSIFLARIPVGSQAHKCLPFADALLHLAEIIA